MFWLVLYLQEAEAALDFNLTKIAHYTTPKLSYPRIYQDYLFCKATEHSNLLFWAELKNPELLNTLNLTYQYQPYSWEILSTFTDAYLFLGASNGVNIYRYSFDLHYRYAFDLNSRYNSFDLQYLFIIDK